MGVRRLAILGLGLLVIAGPAAAQTAIGVRERGEGVLEAQDAVDAGGRLYDCYRVEGDPDRWLSVSLTSAGFDAVLEAGRGPSCLDGEIRNDDNDGGANARVYLQPRPDDWFIRVSTYDADESGSYFLWVAPVDGPPEPPPGGPNPFRGGTTAMELPFSAEDWVRPRDARMRYRWDAMCLGVHRVLSHERVARPAVSRDQAERETAMLTDALARSTDQAGHTDAEAEEASGGWARVAMSLSHDGMILPHPVAPGLQRACVKQLAAGDQAEGSSAPANIR